MKVKITNNKLRFSPPDSIVKYNEIENRYTPKLSDVVQDPRNYLKEYAVFGWSIFLSTLLLVLYVVILFAINCYNQWFLASSPLPLLSRGICYMIVEFFICMIVRFRLEANNVSKSVRLSLHDSFLSVAPIGIANAFRSWLLSEALQVTTVPLFKMITSSVIVFILVLAIVFKLEKKSWLLAGTVALIFGGQVAFNYEPTEIHVLGFIFALTGSFASSFRWTLPQRLMQQSRHGLSSPIDLMYYMQPWMILFLIPVAFSLEGFQIFTEFSDWPLRSVLFHVAVIIVGGILAFCLELITLIFVSRTSSLTLCVAAILMWMLIQISFPQPFRDESKLSKTSFLGTQTCFAGIILYAILRLWTTGDEETKEINTVSKSVDANKESVSGQIQV